MEADERQRVKTVSRQIQRVQAVGNSLRVAKSNRFRGVRTAAEADRDRCQATLRPQADSSGSAESSVVLPLAAAFAGWQNLDAAVRETPELSV